MIEGRIRKNLIREGSDYLEAALKLQLVRLKADTELSSASHFHERKLHKVTRIQWGSTMF